MPGNKFRFLVTFLTLLVVQSYAQNSNSGSPYSVYGLGELYATDLSQFQAMGGASSAFQSPIQINLVNPASYAHMRITNYNFGVNGTALRLTNSNEQLDKARYNLAYFSLALPLGKKGGLGFGLQPYSVVDYDVQLLNDTATIPHSERYEGFGGMNRVFLSGAWKPFKYYSDTNALKDLAFGAEIDFFFGNLSNSQFIAFPDSLDAHNLRIVRSDHLYGAAYKLGLQYKRSFTTMTNSRLDSAGTRETRRHQLFFGLNASSNASLAGDRTILAERYRTGFSGLPVVRDTSRFVEIESGKSMKTVLPGSYTIGIGYLRGENLYFAADWTYQPWSNFQLFGQSQDLRDSWNLGLGGYYQPMSLDKYKAGDVYWSIVKYRLGLKYGTGFLTLKEQEITNLGITFGLSLPVRGASSTIERFSSLNIAVELGQRGTIENDLVKEQYVNFVLGFSLLDRWFIKRRYD